MKTYLLFEERGILFLIISYKLLLLYVCFFDVLLLHSY